MALGIVNIMSMKYNAVSYLKDVSDAVATSPLPAMVELTWTDPEDITHNGATLAQWAGTLVVRKAGMEPEDREDGEVIIDSKVKNAYSSTPYTDNNLTNGVTYYYKFFPYDTAGSFVENTTVVSAKPAAIMVELPTITGNLTYTGSEQSPALTYDSVNITATGDLTATNAGEYSITFSLNDNNHIWSDGTYTDKTLSYTISKANNTLTLSKTSGTVEYNSTDTFIVTENTSGGTLSVESADTDWATVTLQGTQATVTCKGYRVETTLITVKSAETANYNAAEITYTLTSAKATGSVTVSKNSITMNASTTQDTFTVTRLGTGTITVTSNNLQVVTVSGTDTVTVTKLGAGNAVITVSVDADNNYTAASTNVSVVARLYTIMTVKIDQSNSNPETCCTYADDAVNMTPGSDEWDEFFGEYPVMLKDGVEGKKLNPNNYTKHTDGTTADITSGNEGDVMVAFPRKGLKISTSGDIITVSMTDNPNDSDFKYYAHQRGTTDKDKFYLGAYKGYVDGSNKLRSLSRKTPTANKTIGAFRTLARANSPASNGSGGSGYDQSGWYPLIFRQAMYVLKYKNLNSQKTIGLGNVGTGSATYEGSINSTGGTNTKGMDYGNKSTYNEQMKLFGIEDFWGNLYEWIDGIITNSSFNILTGTQGFNDTGSGYTNQGIGTTNHMYDEISKVQGTSETGFLIKEKKGSTTTYFCDNGGFNKDSVAAAFGGYWNHTTRSGVFMFEITAPASLANSAVGSRLMYL